MAIAIPMLLLVLFGYALKLDVDNVPLIVWDQSNTPASREFLAYFTGSRYFELRQYATGYHDIEKAIDKGDALVGLVIPRDFAESAQSLAPVRVQAIVDGSDSNTATIALGYLDAISMAYSKDVLIEQTRRIVGKVPEGSIDFRPRVWFNADLESKNYIIPGLIAVIMMVIAALLTSLTVSKEWEQGTMEQLISTPVKGPELIVGKLLPYFAVGMLDVLLAVLMGVFLFDVPLRGSVPLLFAVSAAFLVGALALGMLITLMLTSMAVVREKEVGTMEQIMVTPITPGEFILGKTAPFAVIGFADVLLITIVAVFWFQVPIRGSLPLLFIATGRDSLSPACKTTGGITSNPGVPGRPSGPPALRDSIPASSQSGDPGEPLRRFSQRVRWSRDGDRLMRPVESARKLHRETAGTGRVGEFIRHPRGAVALLRELDVPIHEQYIHTARNVVVPEPGPVGLLGFVIHHDEAALSGRRPSGIVDVGDEESFNTFPKPMECRIHARGQRVGVGAVALGPLHGRRGTRWQHGRQHGGVVDQVTDTLIVIGIMVHPIVVDGVHKVLVAAYIHVLHGIQVRMPIRSAGVGIDAAVIVPRVPGFPKATRRWVGCRFLAVAGVV